MVACGSGRGAPMTPTAAPGSAMTALAVTAADGAARMSGQELAFNAVTSLVAGTACPTLQFMISSYAIRTDANTRYEGGSCATVRAGTRVALTATRTGDNPQAVYASLITFAPSTTPPAPAPGTVPPTTPPPPTPPPPAPVPTAPPVPVSADVEIGSLVDGSVCPTLSFMIGPYTIAVNASTRFEGGTCAGLRAGLKIGLTGTKTDGNNVVATSIVFRDRSGSPNPPAPPSGEPRTPQVAEGEGTVASIVSGTACPSLRFMIGPYTIALSAATEFVDSACSDVRTGVTVRVKGSVGSDGVVSASLVSMRRDATTPQPEAEGEGFVTALVAGTSCPALQFMVGEYTITATPSTAFVGATCDSVAVGRKVFVRGRMTGEKTATASQVVVRN
jgi:hypothetical protein